jgi:hypothetical protein
LRLLEDPVEDVERPRGHEQVEVVTVIHGERPDPGISMQEAVLQDGIVGAVVEAGERNGDVAEPGRVQAFVDIDRPDLPPGDQVVPGMQVTVDQSELARGLGTSDAFHQHPGGRRALRSLPPRQDPGRGFVVQPWA